MSRSEHSASSTHKADVLQSLKKLKKKKPVLPTAPKKQLADFNDMNWG